MAGNLIVHNTKPLFIEYVVKKQLLYSLDYFFFFHVILLQFSWVKPFCDEDNVNVINDTIELLLERFG